MDADLENTYNHIRGDRAGFYEQPRGLIAVWGKEAVQFLDGLVSNDMKTLVDGGQMLAAFPNAQGRLLAIVRVLRKGDRYLIETEGATREKVFQNLFRFTFAGDFFVEDLSDQYMYFEMVGANGSEPGAVATGFLFASTRLAGHFINIDSADAFRSEQTSLGAVEITGELYEVLRVENGIPKYGIDMDDTTIVPEIGIDGLISYNKGCYIGQEIIARIHFRGHVAKQLTGLILSEPPAIPAIVGGLGDHTDASETLTVQSADGKNAGRITSFTFSPKLGQWIALAFVRYAHLAAGTELIADGQTATVTNLPFIN